MIVPIPERSNQDQGFALPAPLQEPLPAQVAELPSPTPAPALPPVLILDPRDQARRAQEIHVALACLSEDLYNVLHGISTETFCNDQPLQVDKDRSLARRKEAQKAYLQNKESMEKLKKCLPTTKTLEPVSVELKTEIQTQATRFVEAVGQLEEGSSLVIAGAYGQKRSITKDLLQLGHTFLGKNAQALPPILRQAFQHGSPDVETLVRALFSIPNTQAKPWQDDPVAKKILSLIQPEMHRARFKTKVTKLRGKENPVDLLLQKYPHINLLKFKRDDLLDALIPKENNAFHSLLAMLLPPAVMEQLSQPNSPQTAVEVIKPFLIEIYKHIKAEVADSNKAALKETIEKALAKWMHSKGVAKANQFTHNAFPVDKLAARWEILKQKEAEGPEALLEELGNMALEMMGEKHIDFEHLITGRVDDNVEIIVRDLLKQLPAELRALTQGLLLSPTGDYLIKCIKRGNDTYDVELYLSGPLLSHPEFQNKWPIRFQGIQKSCLNEKFFQGLLQHTLALQPTAPFSSSPELFHQHLLASLGNPYPDNHSTPTITNERFSGAELAFNYISCNPQTYLDNPQNPTLQRFLWQFSKLKKLVNYQTENGVLQIDTLDRAKVLDSAASQLLYTAEGMKDQFPEVQEKIEKIRATCKKVKEACARKKKITIQEHNARAVDAPTPFEIPYAFATLLAPQYAKVKKGIETAERFFRHVPFSQSWVNVARDKLLQKVFKLKSEDALSLYTILNKQLVPVVLVTPPAAAENTARTRILEALQPVIRWVNLTVNTIYAVLSNCLNAIQKHSPAPLSHLIQLLTSSLKQAAIAIQDRIVEWVVNSVIHHYLADERELKKLSSFGKQCIDSMYLHPTLNFNIPDGMQDGSYPANEFPSLRSLNGFAPLHSIQVTILGGQIQEITMPHPIPGTHITFTNQNGNLVHPEYGKLSLQQHHPRLSLFRPYLLVENEAGEQKVLLREVLVADQLTHFNAESQVGTVLWNGVKPLIPQSVQDTTLYTCRLTETHLTSDTPEALLYVMRAYLTHNEDEAALAAFEAFKEQITRDPNSLLPKDLAMRLAPFALCTSPAASKIRLSLFAMLETQRKTHPEIFQWNNHPLHGFLWLLICADFQKAGQDCTEEESALAQTAMMERIKEHLPFYTAKDITLLLKQLFHLEGDVSEENIQAFIEGAIPMLHQMPAQVNRALTKFLMIPDTTPVRKKSTNPFLNADLYTNVAFSTFPQLEFALRVAQFTGRQLQPVASKFSIKNLPVVIPHLLRQTNLTPIEKEALRSFFSADVLPLEVGEQDEPINFKTLSLLPINAIKLKANFWHYYKACYDDSQLLDGSSAPLNQQLALLQQELGGDPQAKVLARVLAQLLKLTKEGKGQYLRKIHQNPDAFYPKNLCAVLKQEEMDAFLSLFEMLLTDPSAMLPHVSILKWATKKGIISGMKAVALAGSGFEKVCRVSGKVTSPVTNAVAGTVGQVKASIEEGVHQAKVSVQEGVTYVKQTKASVEENLALTREFVQVNTAMAKQAIEENVQQGLFSAAASTILFKEEFNERPLEAVTTAASSMVMGLSNLLNPASYFTLPQPQLQIMRPEVEYEGPAEITEVD